MTDEQIDAMEAGREMDALIAEKVFGLDAACWVSGCEITAHQIPPYSIDIGAAWLVVEKLNIIVWPLGTGSYKAIKGKVKAYAQSAPLAICRAALKCCKNVADKKEDAEIAPSWDWSTSKYS